MVSYEPDQSGKHLRSGDNKDQQALWLHRGRRRRRRRLSGVSDVWNKNAHLGIASTCWLDDVTQPWPGRWVSVGTPPSHPFCTASFVLPDRTALTITVYTNSIKYQSVLLKTSVTMCTGKAYLFTTANQLSHGHVRTLEYNTNMHGWLE